MCTCACVCVFFNEGDVRGKAHKKELQQNGYSACLQALQPWDSFFLYFHHSIFPTFIIKKSKCDVKFKIKIYPEGLLLRQVGDARSPCVCQHKMHVTLG